VRPGNVHALGSRAYLEDKALVTNDEIGLEDLTVALLGRLHEGD